MLPYIQSTRGQQRQRTIDFMGYNDSPVILDGEMRDMLNLSSEKFPKLYQRNLRNTYRDSFVNPVAIFARKEKLAVVDQINDTECVFYYGTVESTDPNAAGQTIPKLISGFSLLPGEKSIAAINTRIVIYPDKKWFNTEDETYGNIENIVQSGVETVTFTGNTITFGGTGTPFADFHKDEAIIITGSSIAANNLSAVISDINGLVLTFPDNTFTAGASTTEITISRTAPDMDFIMESNNRLWGCKESTIYASKLGDPLNWNYFQGLSLDSYSVPVGTDGDFTGCIPYPSHLLFFKEDYIHKLYGSKPINYQLVDAKCYSLESGSHQSLAVINEVVFYKSRMGIMAYTGGTPELLSKNFGTKRYGKAVAGTDGIKYYVSLAYGTTHDLMVFDLQKALWHKEDHTNATGFAFINGELIYIDEASGRLVSVNPLTADESDQIQWSAILGEFDEYQEDKKIYSKLKMRMELEENADITISVSYDSTDWEQVAHIYAEKSRSVYIPIIPRRCDKFKIKLEGKGFCLIESMVRDYTMGSEK